MLRGGIRDRRDRDRDRRRDRDRGRDRDRDRGRDRGVEVFDGGRGHGYGHGTGALVEHPRTGDARAGKACLDIVLFARSEDSRTGFSPVEGGAFLTMVSPAWCRSLSLSSAMVCIQSVAGRPGSPYEEVLRENVHHVEIFIPNEAVKLRRLAPGENRVIGERLARLVHANPTDTIATLNVHLNPTLLELSSQSVSISATSAELGSTALTFIVPGNKRTSSNIDDAKLSKDLMTLNTGDLISVTMGDTDQPRGAFASILSDLLKPEIDMKTLCDPLLDQLVVNLVRVEDKRTFRVDVIMTGRVFTMDQILRLHDKRLKLSQAMCISVDQAARVMPTPLHFNCPLCYHEKHRSALHVLREVQSPNSKAIVPYTGGFRHPCHTSVAPAATPLKLSSACNLNKLVSHVQKTHLKPAIKDAASKPYGYPGHAEAANKVSMLQSFISLMEKDARGRQQFPFPIIPAGAVNFSDTA